MSYSIRELEFRGSSRATIMRFNRLWPLRNLEQWEEPTGRF